MDETTQETTMTANCTQTGDLGLARHLMREDSFLDGHTGLDADEYTGDAAPSEPGTISIHLNGEVADALLVARGWKREQHRDQGPRGRGGRTYYAWVAPDGDGERYWHTSEALTIALTAEAC
jgi:hypothetical protein